MKQIANGLQLLPLLNDPGVSALDIPADYPPIYTSFLRTFEVGKKIRMKGIEVLHERFGEKLPMVRVYYLPNIEEISLGALYRPDEAREIYERIYDRDDPEDRTVFGSETMLIGEDGPGYNFFHVGTGSKNMDQIFVESNQRLVAGGRRMTLLANHIYEFLSQFAAVEKEEGVGYGMSYEAIYKKWGEDFWRFSPEG